MSNIVTVTCAVPLNHQEINLIKSSLSLSTQDEVSVNVDPSLIAGVKVTVNGKTVDLSVKQQLVEIAQQ